jgi:hypothetical protein
MIMFGSATTTVGLYAQGFGCARAHTPPQGLGSPTVGAMMHNEVVQTEILSPVLALQTGAIGVQAHQRSVIRSIWAVY